MCTNCLLHKALALWSLAFRFILICIVFSVSILWHSLYNICFNLKYQQKIKAEDFGSAAGMKLLSEVETNELCANF